MTLLNAPAYDERKERRNHNLLVGSGVFVAAMVVLSLAGFLLGHGWLFTNLPAEHRMKVFLSVIEAQDYPKAYGIYYNDPDWQQHPAKYSSYPLARFTDDWTTASPVNAPITSHHVDKSVVSGTGNFGTGVIVATTVNGDKKIFLYVNRADKTITWPAPYVFKY